ncbi:hypothetical protein MKW98_008655, partial [Papaver atlanticum]
MLFDNRSWIPVTNILLQLCKSSGFVLSRHGVLPSVLFQVVELHTCGKKKKALCLMSHAILQGYWSSLLIPTSLTCQKQSKWSCENPCSLPKIHLPYLVHALAHHSSWPNIDECSLIIKRSENVLYVQKSV